jgi:hypothetical protein
VAVAVIGDGKRRGCSGFGGHERRRFSPHYGPGSPGGDPKKAATR